MRVLHLDGQVRGAVSIKTACEIKQHIIHVESPSVPRRSICPAASFASCWPPRCCHRNHSFNNCTAAPQLLLQKCNLATFWSSLAT